MSPEWVLAAQQSIDEKALCKLRTVQSEQMMSDTVRQKEFCKIEKPYLATFRLKCSKRSKPDAIISPTPYLLHNREAHCVFAEYGQINNIII